MSPINLVLNILWFLFGGLWMALSWAIAGLIMALTIVGLPWTRAAFTLALYTLAPFGRTVVRRDLIEGLRPPMDREHDPMAVTDA